MTHYFSLYFLYLNENNQIEVGFGTWTREDGTCCLVGYDLFGSTLFVESKHTTFI